MLRPLMTLALGLLAGCMANQFSQYAGQDIREVMIDYGEPVNAFDMPDGTRAFQWVLNNSYQTPTEIVSHRNLDDQNDPDSWVFDRTTIFGGERVESSCLYTLRARWDGSIDGWRVIEVEPASMTCHR